MGARAAYHWTYDRSWTVHGLENRILGVRRRYYWKDLEFVTTDTHNAHSDLGHHDEKSSGFWFSTSAAINLEFRGNSTVFR
jgi:hypothetical protein